jgi:hypothetical protein
MSGIPVIISNVAGDDRIQYPDEAKKEGIVSIVSIPIRISGVVLGTLRLYHNKVWEVPEDDMNSLVLLAEFVGLAMNYANVMDTVCEINDLIKWKIPSELIRKD